MPTKITNIKELRDDLIDSYDMLKKDPRRVVQVGELANTAGKILGTVKVQLEYAKLRVEKPDIAFLNDGK